MQNCVSGVCKCGAASDCNADTANMCVDGECKCGSGDDCGSDTNDQTRPKCLATGGGVPTAVDASATCQVTNFSRVIEHRTNNKSLVPVDIYAFKLWFSAQEVVLLLTLAQRQREPLQQHHFVVILLATQW